MSYSFSKNKVITGLPDTERWDLGLRVAYWLFLKQKQASGLLDWIKTGPVK